MAFTHATSHGLLPQGNTLLGTHTTSLSPGQTLFTLQFSLKPHFSKKPPLPAEPPSSEAKEEMLSIVSFPKTEQQEVSTAFIGKERERENLRWPPPSV